MGQDLQKATRIKFDEKCSSFDRKYYTKLMR